MTNCDLLVQDVTRRTRHTEKQRSALSANNACMQGIVCDWRPVEVLWRTDDALFCALLFVRRVGPVEEEKDGERCARMCVHYAKVL